MSRNTDASLTILALVVGLILLFLWHDHFWLLYLALGLGLGSVMSAVLRRALAAAWLGLGRGLGRIVSPLLLATVFFLVMWPLALLRRLSRRDDPLALHDRPDSLFIPAEDPGFPESFTRRW